MLAAGQVEVLLSVFKSEMLVLVAAGGVSDCTVKTSTSERHALLKTPPHLLFSQVRHRRATILRCILEAAGVGKQQA
jgi:hypothetical protein